MGAELLALAAGVDQGPEPERGQRLYQVHEYQARAIHSKKHITVFPAGRRTGKTEAAALWVVLKAAEAAQQRTGGLIWCVFPQYQHGVRAWEAFFGDGVKEGCLPRGWLTGVNGTVSHPGNITLLDRVRVEFKSGWKPEGLVGAGVLALWVDECGTLPERAWNESLRPTLIDRGAPALLTGTPKGVGQWFHTEYAKGWDPATSGEYESIGLSSVQGVPSYANPFIDPANIDREAAEMSAFVRSQEVHALFLSNEGSVFKLERVIANGLGLSVLPTVALGVDLGRFNDATVLVGMDRNQAVTYFERLMEVDWPLQLAKIQAAWKSLGYPYVVLDATHGSIGNPVSEELNRLGMAHEPFEFTTRSKVPLIERLIIACDRADLYLPDEPVLLTELRMFTREQMASGYIRYAAPEGKMDDTVMALALALYGCQRYGDSGVTL